MSLSTAQCCVFNHLVLGKSNQEIATELGISHKTVKAHVTDILKKAHMRSRYELMAAHYLGTLVWTTEEAA